MLEKLKSLFSKKEPEIKEPKRIHLEESRNLFNKKMKDLEKTEIQEINSVAEKITGGFTNIKNTLKELRDLQVPEKRAHASQVIKDKWVERQETTLTSFLNQNKKISSIQEFRTYMSAVDKALEGIKISPVEAGHIRFFFPDQLARISRSTNEIIDLNTSLKIRTESGFMKNCGVIQDIYNKLEELEEKIARNSSETEKSEYETSENRKKLSDIEFFDIKELDEANASIGKLDLERRRIYQKIDSTLGSITRYLKKFSHKSQNKTDISIMKAYIENPHKAFLEDDNNRIRDILLRLIIFVKDERIEIESKSVQKIESVLAEIDSLAQEKKRMMEITEEIEEIRQRIDSELIPKEEKNKENLKLKKHLEKSIEKNQETMQKFGTDNESMRNSIASLKKSLGMKLSDLLKEKLVIE